MRNLTNIDAVSGGFVKEHYGGTYDVINDNTGEVVATKDNIQDAFQDDMDINETDTVQVKRFLGPTETYFYATRKVTSDPNNYSKHGRFGPCYKSHKYSYNANF